MKRKHEIRITNRRSRTDTGSALILTVVLTSLLAIIGVMFMMVARVDKISTSAIIENKELYLAVDSVIAKISEQLILDTPGIVDPNQPVREYYDYPDLANPWLASLEPVFVSDNGTPLITNDDIYNWPHISDIYDVIDPTTGFKKGLLESWVSLGLVDVSNLPAGPDDLVVSIVSPSDEVGGVQLPGSSINFFDFGGPADADGDGVADSRWVQLPDTTGSKGEPIFTAVRIIDNSSMLNVNTAYKFDPNDGNPAMINGSSQMQIDLLTLAERGVNPNALLSLDNVRFGSEPHNLNNYITNVVWRYNKPLGAYTPFDISDELELRNGFTLNHEYIDTRIEKELAWARTFNDPNELHTPVQSSGVELEEWFYRTQHDVQGPIDIYSYRHIATTYNMDRIIDPNGRKMVNVNNVISRADVNSLRDAIWTGLESAGFVDTDRERAAQMAANIKDYRDRDSDVTDINDLAGNTYYGFETPCIYISELTHWFNPTPLPNITDKSYAIEFYKPYPNDVDPNGWQLVVDGNPPISIIWPTGRQFCVLRNQHPDAEFEVDPLINIDPAVVRDFPGLITFDAGSNIQLQRSIQGVGYVTVDNIIVPSLDPASGWLREGPRARSFQRDITLHKCIRRLWDASFSQVYPPTFGVTNSYIDPDSYLIQAHPANTAFTNIGEIGMVFRKDPNAIDPSDIEASVRIDLANPIFQQLFKYMTVFDPANDFIDNDGDLYTDEIDEIKVPGRININTAPWYVIAQLPWISDHTPNFDLARAIVDYRDNMGLGFDNIGQLNNVVDPNSYRSIDYYARDGIDQPGFPDLTPGDNMVDDAANDFEERDVIFSRISNLVTVRSDVFTAYILVRIGADGPQKRVIAILDRSDVYSPADKVKIVALHPVPDPR